MTQPDFRRPRRRWVPASIVTSRRWSGPSRRVWLGVFVAAVLAQLVAVYSPGAPHGPEVNGFDKVVHALIFGLPAAAGLAAGLRPRWLLAALAVHGAVSELVQWAALPHRDGDVRDVAADLAGLVLGWLLWRAVPAMHAAQDANAAQDARAAQDRATGPHW